MGVDAYDLLLRIERTFYVDLSQEDFVDLMRDHDIAVGDLYDLLLKKMDLRDVGRHDILLNYHLWVEMQRVLQCVSRVPGSQIELKTPLEKLFPRETRRAAWDVLRHTCPYRVRELDYPIAYARSDWR